MDYMLHAINCVQNENVEGLDNFINTMQQKLNAKKYILTEEDKGNKYFKCYSIVFYFNYDGLESVDDYISKHMNGVMDYFLYLNKYNIIKIG